MQVCKDGAAPWSAAEWFFTVKPGVFGLYPGIANPTGFGLLACITIMFICSQPFVRKSGYFQVKLWL